MKTKFTQQTLSRLLIPNWSRHYAGVGTLAYLLHRFMAADARFREGSSGVREVLSGYEGCTNSPGQAWHTSRLMEIPDEATWQRHQDHLADILLTALLKDDPLFKRWRKANGFHLGSKLRLPCVYQDHNPAQLEWERFLGWHNHRRQWNRALNSFHPRDRTLCFPQLIVTARGVSVGLEFTSRSELRTSGAAAGRWSLFDHEAQHQPVIERRWTPGKETFAGFLKRINDAIEANLKHA